MCSFQYEVRKVGVLRVVTCLFVFFFFLEGGFFVVILSLPRSSCVCPPLYSIYLPVGVSDPPSCCVTVFPHELRFITPSAAVIICSRCLKTAIAATPLSLSLSLRGLLHSPSLFLQLDDSPRLSSIWVVFKLMKL